MRSLWTHFCRTLERTERVASPQSRIQTVFQKTKNAEQGGSKGKSPGKVPWAVDAIRFLAELVGLKTSEPLRRSKGTGGGGNSPTHQPSVVLNPVAAEEKYHIPLAKAIAELSTHNA